MIDVLIPTFGRAERLAAVAANVHENTKVPHRVVFIVEEDDRPTYEALMMDDVVPDATVVVNRRARSYAGACNTAYARNVSSSHLFAGSDDLRFQPGWAEAALATMDAHERIRVVGTNDGINPYVAAGTHATHYLIDRRYLDEEGGTVDGGPGSFFHEGYGHNFTDTEFVGTAKARVRFLPCLDARVEHLHHSAGLSEHDATHVKAEASYEADSALYDARRPLWQDLSR